MKRVPPLVVAALLCWAAALMLIVLERASWWVFGAAIVVCGYCAAWRSGSRLMGARAIGLVAGAAVAAVALSVAAQVPARDSAVTQIGRTLTFEARVISNTTAPNRERVWVDVLAALGESELAVPLRLAVAEGERVPFGATIRVFAQVHEPWGPGATVATVTALRTVEIVSDGGAVFRAAAELRDAFIDRAAQLPGTGAQLLPGLAVGDTRGVSPEVESAMLHSGLSHLTAVSGANCAIVTAIAFGAATLARFPRWARVAIALTALAGFVVLVTPEPSVIRAATMAAIALLALVLGRARAGGGVLACAVVIALVADPWLAISAGFALSVASTTALLYLMSPLARGLQRFLPRVLSWAIAAPLAAQLACGPIIALFADEQSLVSTLANLLATPVSPVVTVVGMIGCLLAPVPPLADLAVASAWVPAQWIASTAEVAASLPNATVPVVAGPVAAAVVAGASASVALVIIVPRVGGSRSVMLWLLRNCAVVVLASVFAWGVSAALLRTVVAPLTVASHWAIAACDVGQGDAFVVRSGGAVAVIDTGEKPQLLRTCLQKLSIDRVDLLVLTHFDLDHVGGADALVGAVDTVLFADSDAAANADVLARLFAGGAALQPVSSGMAGRLGQLDLRILWPRTDERVFAPGNAQSIVVEFRGEGFPTLLALGDLGASEQRVLLEANPALHADIVKVSHHGSADQHGPLYEALAPSVALIGVGEGNTHGHPRVETLQLLQRLGAATFRTDLHGLTLVIADAKGIAVWTERSAEMSVTHSSLEE